MDSQLYDVVIVGAGSSGLAVAKELQYKSLRVLVVESGPTAGTSWLERYQFTRMTSPKAFVALPQQAFVDGVPEYPTFRQYADYLTSYADNLNVSYNSTVTHASFADNLWHVAYHSSNNSQSITCKNLVVASGRNRSKPKSSTIPGLDEGFGRPILMADDIHDISAWKGKHIFIVGMGNTGMDVGMAMLEAGAKVTFGVRRIPTIASVNILGLGIHSFANNVLDRCPAAVVDFACKIAMLHAFRGGYSKHFPKSLQDSRWRCTQEKRIPTLDFPERSLAQAIKSKRVNIVNGPKLCRPGGIVEGNDHGVWLQVDGVLLATGFAESTPSWLQKDDAGASRLHSVGMHPVVSNPIAATVKEARQIAERITDAAFAVSSGLKITLLFLLCLANFIEILSGSSAIPILSDISKDLHIDINSVQWTLSAYNLTFAAFMLLAGRLSDTFTAKSVFIVGLAWAGIFSLAAGWCTSDVILYTVRALQGIGASFTIPSAIHLICKLFPETKAQATALMAFGTAAAISNIVGLLIGGAVASAGNWRWCMWLIGVVSLPVALLAALLIPSGLSVKTTGRRSLRATVASLDLVGSSLVAIFLILFVYGLTEGNISGWKSAKVIIPIVTSFSIILPFFFIYEEFGRTRRGLEAALPNAAWKLPNFTILFIISLSSFFYYGDLFITYSALWGEGYHWSPMKQAQHFVPAGLATLIAAGIAPPIIEAVGLRYFLSGSMVIYSGGGVLLAHALDPAQYWTRAVPGMSISAVGAGATYLACSQSLVQCGPQSMSGVLGATFNSALQIGYVIAIAVSLALIQNVGDLYAGDGFKASFYAVTVVGGIMAVASLLFVKQPKHIALATGDADISEKVLDSLRQPDGQDDSCKSSPNMVFPDRLGYTHELV